MVLEVQEEISTHERISNAFKINSDNNEHNNHFQKNEKEENNENNCDSYSKNPALVGVKNPGVDVRWRLVHEMQSCLIGQMMMMFNRIDKDDIDKNNDKNNRNESRFEWEGVLRCPYVYIYTLYIYLYAYVICTYTCICMYICMHMHR